MQNRSELLLKYLSEKILVLDGATGTALQTKNLTAKDFGGNEFEGCNENLVLTAPEIVRSVHELYLKSGADIIETNSFGGAKLVLAEYGLENKAYEINFKAAQIAKELALEYSKMDPTKPRFVAGSMGPTTKSLTITGGITFEDLQNEFYEQAKALYEGGVDYFLLETGNDTRNIKAGLVGIYTLLEEKKEKIPVAVSITIEAMGTMLAGQNVEALAASLSHYDLLYVGLNCATGPSFMRDHIRSLSSMIKTRVACVPNAGLPDENGKYLETPEMLASELEQFIDEGWINLVGGCCGTNEKHILKMSQMVLGKKPRISKDEKISVLSGIDYLEISDEKRPLLVGERTNVIGSKKFKDLIKEKKFDEAAEIAKEQVKKGAHIVDICLANPDSNELDDMKNFLEKVIHKVRVPLMIDTTDDQVVKLGLTYSQGKAIINSINLEDGISRFKKIVPLAKKFNASLVVGTIDDKIGMAVSAEEKLAVARRSHEILTKDFNFPEEDIYWDPLVFPCATGDEKYIASAKETIEGLRLIKKEFPKTKSAIGVSNVSFGLPSVGREVLNSVFLYHTVLAGLDLAIVNTEKLKRFSSLTQEEITLSEDVLFNSHPNAIENFIAKFRDQKAKKEEKTYSDLSPSERLKIYVVEGLKKGLIEDLDLQLKISSPLEIINGPLMAGMSEVGRLFNANKLIVAEVLQSAETMKAAVSYLENFMEKKEGSKKGKMVLATVKGDVHDIGKNLVDIILSNNGYEVINLGIKVPPEEIIQAIKKEKPDMLGLSGLLVKSAHQMVTTVSDLKNAGIQIPILCGGAALSQNFVKNKIDTAYGEGVALYAKDAMDGLRLANLVMDKNELQHFTKTWKEKSASETADFFSNVSKPQAQLRSKKIKELFTFPTPPDFERHILKNLSPQTLFKYLNPQMLYSKHLGISSLVVSKFAQGKINELEQTPEGKKALTIFNEVKNVLNEYEKEVLIPTAVYQFFKAYSQGNSLFILGEDEKVLASFSFPRQSREDGLCLSDYISSDKKARDNLAFFVVSIGKNVKEKVSELKNKGEYLKSHILSALALELAEAYAEYLHEKIRGLWGKMNPKEMTMTEIHKSLYEGKRYSFGYPACPQIEDQKTLFELIRPQDIHVHLTDGWMMDPEASVSAIVFHHPEATYFNAKV